MTRSLAVTFNALGLFAIALVLLVAFAAQLLLHELPCPLCLLQRIQFALLAVGPILNIRFGLRPSHYAVSLLTAVAGAAFAARQILLHGDPAMVRRCFVIIITHGPLSVLPWLSSRLRPRCWSIASSRTASCRSPRAWSRPRRCGSCWHSPPRMWSPLFWETASPASPTNPPASHRSNPTCETSHSHPTGVSR